MRHFDSARVFFHRLIFSASARLRFRRKRFASRPTRIYFTAAVATQFLGNGDRVEPRVESDGETDGRRVPVRVGLRGTTGDLLTSRRASAAAASASDAETSSSPFLKKLLYFLSRGENVAPRAKVKKLQPFLGICSSSRSRRGAETQPPTGSRLWTLTDKATLSASDAGATFRRWRGAN